MSKRNADAISQPTAEGIDDTNNNNNSIPPLHYIRQTLLGPVCTHCNTKVIKTKSNFSISDNTLSQHFKDKKCIQGKVNMKALERNLNKQIINMHNRIKGDITKGDELVGYCFPNDRTTTSRSAYCKRCGFAGKLAKVKTHVQSTKNTSRNKSNT